MEKKKAYGDLSKKRGMPVLWFNSQRGDKLPNESVETFRKKMLKDFKALPKRSRYSFWREQIRFQESKKKPMKKRCVVNPEWISQWCDKGLTLKTKESYQRFKKKNNGKCLGPSWLNDIKCGKKGMEEAKKVNLKRYQARKRNEFLRAEAKRLDKQKSISYLASFPKSTKIINEEKRGVKLTTKKEREETKKRLISIIFSRRKDGVTPISIWLKNIDLYLENYKTTNEIRKRIVYLKKLLTKNKVSFILFRSPENRRLSILDELNIVWNLGKYARSELIRGDMVDGKPAYFTRLIKELEEKHINNPGKKKPPTSSKMMKGRVRKTYLPDETDK